MPSKLLKFNGGAIKTIDYQYDLFDFDPLENFHENLQLLLEDKEYTDLTQQVFSALSSQQIHFLYAIPITGTTSVELAYSTKSPLQIIVNGLRTLLQGRGCRNWWQVLVEQVIIDFFFSITENLKQFITEIGISTYAHK